MSAADTLAAVQLAGQISSLSGAASSAFGANATDIFKVFRAVDQVVDAETKDANEDHDGKAAAAPERRIVNFRLCVHSAKGLPRSGSMYAVVRISEGTGTEKEWVHQTQVIADTRVPVWEHCLEQEMDISIVAPKVEVAVYSKAPFMTSVFPDRCLGAAAIPVPAGLTDGPLKGELDLHVQSSLLGFMPLSMPKVLVVWQVCERHEFVPDLNRVAEMDDDTLEKAAHTVSLRLMSLTLRRPTTQQAVSVTFRIRKPTASNGALPSRYSPVTRTMPRGQVHAVVGEKSPDGQVSSDHACSDACWFSEGTDSQMRPIVGWVCQPWTIRESRVALLSHILEATVHSVVSNKGSDTGVGQTKKQMKIGFWREPIGDLMDCIYSNDRVLRFDAKLTTGDGQNLGLLRMELDVCTDTFHRPPPPISMEQIEADYEKLKKNAVDGSVATVQQKESAGTMVACRADGKLEAPVQVRQGLPNQEIWQNTRMYYCTVYADGLHCVDRCADPVVRITMGAFSTQTDSKQRVGLFNDIRWSAPATIASKVISRRAKIELFVGARHDELLGEHTLYDVAVGRLYWLHLFGGAVNAPKPDVAAQMARQAVRPASTYQGTVAVYFGTSRQPQSFFHKLMDERRPCRLVVRLYSGAYLHSLANKRVKVLVQVAGCRLPDNREALRTARVVASGVNVRVIRDTVGRLGFSFTSPNKGESPRISGVDPNREDLQRLSVGDIIDAVDGRPVTDASDLKAQIASLESFTITVHKKRSMASTLSGAANFGPTCGVSGPLKQSTGPNPRHFNPNILSFQGCVDKCGVLRFENDTETKQSGKSLVPFKGAKLKMGSMENGTPQAWVERRTPRSFPLMVPPNVTHAYLYLVEEGEETRPPTVFGRLRLGDTEPSQSNPKWKMLRFDASVRDPEPAHWPSNMAGFMLGSAALSSAFQEEQQSSAAALPRSVRDMANEMLHGGALTAKQTASSPAVLEGPKETAMDLIKPGILPRYTQTPLCTPLQRCVPETTLSVGSPGAPGDVCSAPEGKKRRVYCHVDVLAARELPAMDEDGLCNCCYKIQIQDTMLSMPGGSTKSLSPSFMHRVTIPFDAEVSEHPTFPDCMINPLPPAILHICDRDDAKVFGTTVNMSYETVSTVVLKHRPTVVNRATVFPMLGLNHGGRLDLNTVHKAQWYALDKPAHCAFDPSTGGHDASWQRRPRVLVALGYSFHDEPPEAKGQLVEFEGSGGTICQMRTQKVERIAINIDLLGLRNLPEDLHSAKLHLSSFWEGASADFDIGSSMIGKTRNCDPNFPQEGWEHAASDDTEWSNFWARMRPFTLLAHESRQLEAQPPPDDEDGVPVVQTDDLMGIRVKAPTYQVPVIPYLQMAKPAGGKPTRGPAGQQGPFLLLPAVTFQLRNFMTQQEYGGLTVGLNNLPLKDVDCRPGGWAEYCMDEFQKLPEELRYWRRGARRGRITHLKGVTVMEDAYECFVDVFAADTGELTWDPDIAVGRCLRSTSLFSLQRKDDGHKSCQFFNPSDWMCTDPHFKAEPFDDRVFPSLWLGDTPGSRAGSPLGPSELYKDFLYHSQKDKCFLQSLKTVDLKRRLAEEGWRAASHLVAPESMLEDPILGINLKRMAAKRGVASNRNHNLEYNNTHTFIRPVGHIIHGDDRDSRLLARLRVGMPLALIEQLQDRLRSARDSLEATKRSEDEEVNVEDAQAKVLASEQALAAAEEAEHTHAGTNFLVIKFTKPGLVVWVAPEDVSVWDRPGSLLMAVRLQDDNDVVVPVVVPNFDLRFPFETGWYPRKTLKTRFRHMEARIMQKAAPSAAGSKKKASQAPPGGPLKPVSARAPAKKVEKLWSEDEHGSVASLAGYDRPIHVVKGAFVCRIRQREGCKYYDRAQTRSWAQACLSEHLTLPEDPSLSLTDEQYMEQAMSEFMNLRKPMTLGQVPGNSKDAVPGMLKGNIHVQRCAPDMPLCTQVDMHQRPLSNLWTKSTVFANISVLSIHNLELSRFLGTRATIFRPYLVVSLGSEKQTTQPMEVPMSSLKSGTLSFYKHFQFETILPGRTQLTIQVFAQGVLSDTLIGKTMVDLEDRWMVLKWREFRDSANGPFLRRVISPPQLTYCSINAQRKYQDAKKTKLLEKQEGWTDPAEPEYCGPDEGGHELRPTRAPEDRLPIECADLVCEDEDTAHEEKAGVLRMLLEMSSQAGEERSSLPSQEFVVVVTIWEANNIQFFKDWGERNDVYVQGRFRATDYWGKESHELKFTDTHKFARYKASFNWRWVFTVRAPVAECSLELTLLDADRISENDPIYDPKVYPFDHMMRVAYERACGAKPSLGSLAETVVFDCWPEQDAPPWWQALADRLCCGRRREKRDSALFAKLRMDVEILPKAEADLQPKTEGQVAPPQGRLSLSSAISDFSATASIILGPTVWRNLQLSAATGFLLASLLLIFSLLFYMLSVAQLSGAGQ